MTTAAANPENVCLPINLDAFVLNEKVCDSGQTRIAPITQPDYVSLRLQNDQIQHDVVPQIDLHNSQPGIANPRISTTFTNAFENLDPRNPSPNLQSLVSINQSRLGVYLHWTIPRAYRAGRSQASQPGDPPLNPTFPLVPNRWLLVRILRTWTPASASPDRAAAWVIESDRLSKIEDLDVSVDLETDITPFVAYSNDADTNSDILNNQAENYIGLKTPLATWKENTTAQRVQLTVMNTSNPLFADYAIHNPNVFSTKDNFMYGTDKNGNPLYLNSATCDYIIVGWHSAQGDDPLGVIADPAAPETLQARLNDLFCAAPTLTNSNDTTTTASNLSTGTGRLICHAARYGVAYNSLVKPPTPADTYAAYFGPDVDMEPTALGTSPLDAVMTFLQAHSQDQAFEESTLQFLDPTIVQTLMGIRELLYVSEDDYDSRVQAADLVFSHNFGRSPGGFTWHYNKQKDPNSPPQAPSTVKDSNGKSEVDYLNDLNELQQTWDATSRKLSLLGWALFSEFFKYVSDGTSDSAQNRKLLYSSRIPLLRTEATNLSQMQKDIDSKIAQTAAKVPSKKVANDAFFKRKDPTLLLAGLDSGWDAEFLSNTPTRYSHQTSAAGSGDTSLVGATRTLISKLGLAADLTATVDKLVVEASGGYQSQLSQYGHKQWSQQPFSPQFVEWEGIYYHVDDFPSQWKVNLTESAISASNHSQVRYINPNQLSTLTSPNPREDQRHISGRMLILPQPSFALGAVVGSVVAGTPLAELPSALQTKDQQTQFIQNVQSLKFISGELTGLTDALVTMAAGQHVKPNVRPNGAAPHPMKAAVDVGSNIGLQSGDFDLIGADTGQTPYGTLTDFTNVNANPFKSVQHGQFALTKLTIVDKFGQAIACPTPTRQLRNQSTNVNTVPSFIHPCLSEQLIPSVLNGTLNTVFTTQDTQDRATTSGYPMTPFAQLTPAINQEARINTTFVENVSDANGNSSWKPTSDWENPIFGWIVVNYADSALQFFTADGIYYTSMEFGGPTGTIQTRNFLPFDPPLQSNSLVSDQLLALIQKMKGENGQAYFLALWNLIEQAIVTMPFPPSDYAAYANAIVGKPLALVNAGWSLELAQPPYWPQHTLPAPPVLGSSDNIDPLRVTAMKNLSAYQFPIKIGDSERPFDGVVAYWDSNNGDPTKPDATTNFDNIYTYFPSDPNDTITPKIPNDPRVGIDPSNYPALSPYFIDPEPYSNGTGFVEKQTSQLMVKTLLIDPYTPIHLYSGILPIKDLQLPGWTLSQAMKNMTAFFSMGPLLITTDVPKVYDPTKPLEPDTWLATQNNATVDDQPAPIKLPIASGKGLWDWLQPYSISTDTTSNASGTGTTGIGTTSGTATGSGTTQGSGTGTGTGDATGNNTSTSTTTGTDTGTGGTGNTTNTVTTTTAAMETRYNSLSVGQEDGRLRLDPAPYTFVEGFMQLARPLVQAEVVPQT